MNSDDPSRDFCKLVTDLTLHYSTQYTMQTETKIEGHCEGWSNKQIEHEVENAFQAKLHKLKQKLMAKKHI